jgi:putative NADH-flavin reductase
MSTKKIALFGADGQVMKKVAEEALRRGHIVIAVVRIPNEFRVMHPRLKVVSGDIMNRSEVSKYARGQDVVICVHEPALSHPQRHIDANRAIIEGARSAGVQHIISFGHPISLKLENSKEFHDLWRPVAEAQRETLKLFKNEQGLHWGYVHSVGISRSKKSRYSISDEIILSNKEGKNKIDVTQLAKILLDEAERTEYVWEVNERHL